MSTAGGPIGIINPGNLSQVWHPPIEIKWMIAIFIVFVGSVANRINPEILRVFTNTIGFFVTGLLALASFYFGFIPGAFAIIYFLLISWSLQLTSKPEGFLNASNTMDWVTNCQRWFVEKVLKERPIAIQEKGVNTFPVQGASSQSGSISGNT